MFRFISSKVVNPLAHINILKQWELDYKTVVVGNNHLRELHYFVIENGYAKEINSFNIHGVPQGYELPLLILFLNNALVRLNLLEDGQEELILYLDDTFSPRLNEHTQDLTTEDLIAAHILYLISSEQNMSPILPNSSSGTPSDWLTSDEVEKGLPQW